MKQKKQIAVNSKSKPKFAKITKQVKTRQKFNSKFLTSVLMLFISLFVIVFFSSQSQNLKSDAQQPSPSIIIPTFGSIGDCRANNTCPKELNSPQRGQGINSFHVAGGIRQRPNNVINTISSSTQNPCINAKNATTTIESTHGNNQGIRQLILRFFQLIFRFIQQLFGGHFPA